MEVVEVEYKPFRATITVEIGPGDGRSLLTPRRSSRVLPASGSIPP
jgi:hypothetical protein